MIIVIMQSTIAVGISLPKEIITKIDSERGDIPRSRYLLRLLEKMYKSNKNGEKLSGNTENSQDPLDSRLRSLQSSESSSP
jgi:hypothetical protein